MHGGEPQPALDKMSQIARRARTQMPSPDDFHTAQHTLWTEMRAAGSPWLITDFLTFGSPLAHAHLLLADNRKELRRLQQFRELPVFSACPRQEIHRISRRGPLLASRAVPSAAPRSAL